MTIHQATFPKKESPVNIIVPVFLVLINLFLKILFIDSRDISMDEPFTIFYSQASFRDLFEMLKTENNPPLFFLLLHYWIKLAGISAFSVRFLPMLFSTSTVLLIYLTGKRFFSFRVGITAALIFTFSNYHLLFAHEARVYSLFALLSSASMYLFLQLTNRRNVMTLPALGFTNLVLLYAHFFGFYVIFIQLSCIISIKDMRAAILKDYLLCLTVVIVCYLPYLSIFLSRFWLSSMHGTWVPKPVISDLYNMVWKFSNAPVTTVFILLVLLTAFLLYLVRKKETKPGTGRNAAVILVWFFLPYLLMFAVSFKVPMFLDRYLVFVSPGFYLLIAISASYIAKKDLAFYFLGGIIILLMVVTFRPREENKRKVTEVVETVKSLKSKETVVVICPEWLDLGFAYYYNRDYFTDFKNLPAKLRMDKVFAINSIDQADTSMLNRASDVIYIEEWATLVDKENRIFGYLKNRFTKCEKAGQFEPINVYHFKSD